MTTTNGSDKAEGPDLLTNQPQAVARFYTFQDEQDRRRLQAGGEPWLTGLSRAFLSVGVYAWSTAHDADVYRSVLTGRRVTDARVLVFEIAAADLHALNTIDLTRLTDAEANVWLYTHSEWAALPTRRPHAYDHMIRRTNNGRHEHHFCPAAFARFRTIGRPVVARSDVGPALQGD